MPRANKFVPPIDSDLQFMNQKKEKEVRKEIERGKEEKIDYWLKVLKNCSVLNLRKLLFINKKIPPSNLSEKALVAKNNAIEQLIKSKFYETLKD